MPYIRKLKHTKISSLLEITTDKFGLFVSHERQLNRSGLLFLWQLLYSGRMNKQIIKWMNGQVNTG